MILTEDKNFIEVADEIFKALLKQNAKCMDHAICAYSNEKGQHCAVGFLLPEDDSNCMDYAGPIDELSDDPTIDLGVNSLFIEDHVNELMHLQKIHDHAGSPQVETYFTELNQEFPEIAALESIQQWIDVIVDE